MAASRRTIVLAAALGVTVLIVALVWTSGGSGATSGPSLPPRAPAPRTQSQTERAATDPVAVGRVNLEALTTPRADPVDGARNPFRFQERRPTAPPPAASSGTSSLPPPKAVDQAPVFTAPPVPTGPPPPPPIPLKFIGVVTQGSKRVAVLTDGKSGPQHGVEGDIILGQYQILKIGNESIEMAYFDGRGRTTIRMTGGQ
jgi:hypothetical protein